MIALTVIGEFTDDPTSIAQQIGFKSADIYPWIRSIVIYPIIEEMMFRGYLYRYVSDRIKTNQQY